MVTRESIREVLMTLFEAETGNQIGELNDDLNMAEQLGIDSVDMVSLIMQLERHFKIRMSHEELTAATTVGLLLDLVQTKVNNPQTDVQKAAA